MIAGVLADSDAFQIGYPLALVPISAVISALYAERRAQRAPQPPAGGSPMSVTQVLHVHYHAERTRSAPSRAARSSWMDDEPLGAAVLLLVLFAVALFVIARGYAEIRDGLLFALLTLASINFGTALGAIVAIRTHAWLDRSWRWPATACVLVAVIAGVDVYLLLHPAFGVGDYDEVFRSFLRDRSIFEGAFADVDASAFVAFQGIAALLVVAVLTLSLMLVAGLWAAVEESVGLRPGLLPRVARRLRYADRRWASAALVVFAVFSATMCAGWYYELFKKLQARWDDNPPTVSSLRARTSGSKVTVTMTVREPVRVVVTVRRGTARSGSRAEFELRPGGRRLSLYARTDRGRLRPGRYRVSLVIRDEAGNATRRQRLLRVR
jgi:hypothetical protein